MTYQRKKKIGHFLLFLIAPIIIYCSLVIYKFNQEINKGINEILLTLPGTETKEQDIRITYRYSHGLYVNNARWCEDNEAPDVIVNDGEYLTEICFADDEKKAVNIPTRSVKDFSIKVIENFNGTMTFGNTVCGCEVLGILVYIAGGGVISLILIVIATGFYFSARKQKLSLNTAL